MEKPEIMQRAPVQAMRYFFNLDGAPAFEARNEWMLKILRWLEDVQQVERGLPPIWTKPELAVIVPIPEKVLHWDDEVPVPGSDEALELGCTCPVMDNHRGAGIVIDGSVQYWYAEDCPIHYPGVK